MKRETAVESSAVRKQVSAAEWQMRVELAACYRLVDLQGWTDLIATHISGRVPGEPGHFLINPYGMGFGEITASSLLKLDEEGNVLLLSEHPFNDAGFVIHGAIHEARPDVNCIIHLHTDDGVAVSAQEDGLLPISQTALACRANVAYHEFEGVAVDMDERARLGTDLGDKDLMILRNHGTLACGATVAEAWTNIHTLERACSIQVRAMTGRLHLPSQKVIDLMNTQFGKIGKTEFGRGAPVDPAAGQAPRRKTYPELVWPSMLRKLDRIDPGYRD
jgi:ribulose-5-phosphate 4-epimerase/fuculose-1-phosphate aldolase